MTTITVDIIDAKAINLLKELEAMNVIRLHKDELVITDEGRAESIKNLKGKMTKQPLEEIERQLAEFRAE